MTKARTKLFLVGYFMIFFGAVFLRIDYFPLSWVPMYGFREEGEQLTVAVGDLKRRDLGFEAIRANGERVFLSRRDLNIPPANFRRLYQERAFGEGPPQHRRERAQLNRFNAWWYERMIGEDPARDPRYPEQLLKSVNATFGHQRGDPRAFVRLAAHLDFATYTRAELDSGELTHPVRDRRESVTTPAGNEVTRTLLDAPLTQKGGGIGG